MDDENAQRERRFAALRLAIQAQGDHSSKENILSMAEAFDTFLEGREDANGNAA